LFNYDVLFRSVSFSYVLFGELVVRFLEMIILIRIEIFSHAKYLTYRALAKSNRAQNIQYAGPEKQVHSARALSWLHPTTVGYGSTTYSSSTVHANTHD
jgi:hypothetical protein